MYIVDSNLIIYSSQSAYAYLRPIIGNDSASISEITRLETLGFSRIEPQDKIYFESLFTLVNIHAIDKKIIEKAIELRQTKKMSVGDAIIAATALLLNLDLYTNSTSDFSFIKSLKIFDPTV